MKTNISYDKERPARRLEKNDTAIICVSRSYAASKKDIEKYGHLPNGTYHAICTKPYYFICKEYPLLNGTYTYWGGNKSRCSYGIYVDEK